MFSTKILQKAEIISLGSYGYPSRSFVMANHSFQMKYRYG